MLLTFYHNVKPMIHCPDGLASAWVVYKRFPESEFIGYSPLESDATFETFSELYPSFEKFSKLLFVDCVIPPNIVTELEAKGKTVRIIDHHIGNFEMFSLSNFGSQLFTFDEMHCGATLTWQKLMGSNPLPVFLEYVRDRDTGKNKLEYTEYVHAGLSSKFYKLKQLEDKFTLMDYLYPLSRQDFLDLVVEKFRGKELYENRLAKMQGVYNRSIKYDITIAGVTMPAIELKKSYEMYRSDIGRMYLQDSQAECVAIVMNDRISLRSVGDFDTTKLSQQYKGNGHKNASAFNRANFVY